MDAAGTGRPTATGGVTTSDEQASSSIDLGGDFYERVLRFAGTATNRPKPGAVKQWG